MALLNDLLKIEYPIILAPMFLVSNEAMIKAALDNGITGAIPALNYRRVEEMRTAIKIIKEHSSRPFGINLIVNKSNPRLREQLQVCLEEKVDFLITSLGNPKEVIEQAHKIGTQVYCDVTDARYAEKVVKLGADALIAVNNRAGGHLGSKSARDLYMELSVISDIPIIAAGGVSNKERLQEALQMGYAGASIGTIFIPTHESPVAQEYKQACVDFSAKDVVMTTKLSGTPCTVINTPYIQEVGTQQHWLERLLNRNKKLKKYLKMLMFVKGMKKLKKAAFGTTYKTVWCAGTSIEDVHDITSVKEVIRRLTD